MTKSAPEICSSEASHATGMADAAGCKDWDADEVTGQGLNVLGYTWASVGWEGKIKHREHRDTPRGKLIIPRCISVLSVFNFFRFMRSFNLV